MRGGKGLGYRVALIGVAPWEVRWIFRQTHSAHPTMLDTLTGFGVCGKSQSA